MNAAPTTPPSPMTPNAAVIGSSALSEHKTCIKCCEAKPLSAFRGRRKDCRKCEYATAKVWAQKPENKERNRQRDRAYWAARTPEQITRCQRNNKRWRTINKSQERANVKRWRATNPNQRKAIGRRAQKKYVDAIPLAYAKTVLMVQTGIPTARIPDSLARAKQQNLKLKRTICSLLKT